jgi:hypothetical protein
MDDENKYTLNDLIKFSADQKPIDFGQAFTDLMQDKIQAAVENRKLEIAQTMFRSPKEEE